MTTRIPQVRRTLLGHSGPDLTHRLRRSHRLPKTTRFRRTLVESGAATGILAFADEKPVGWCAIGPRERYRRIVSGRALRRDAPEGTWSLNCFYVLAKHRGQRVAQALIDAATTWALGQGARAT